MIERLVRSTAAAAIAALSSGSVAAAEAPVVAPYGTWRSPVSAASLAESAIHMRDLRVVGDTLYWNESRPTEKGRTLIMSDAGGKASAATLAGFDVRTRVHEYGGASYLATADVVYFSNFADQRLYEQRGQSAPRALTPAGYRYADCVAHPAGDVLICVREDHTSREVKNAIVAVKRSGGDAGTVLFGKSDFAAYPRLSTDGRKLAWIAWDHPNMPWDTTTLYVADFAAGSLANVKVVAGGSNESVLEPQWGDDGALYFMSDRNDFWNLFVWRGARPKPCCR